MMKSPYEHMRKTINTILMHLCEVSRSVSMFDKMCVSCCCTLNG